VQKAPSGVDASTEDEEDYSPGFGLVDLLMDAGLPSMMLGDTQTMDNDDSAKHCLENFTKPPPTKAVLPLRSKRLAAQSLSRVPASKLGEIQIKRLGLVTGLSNAKYISEEGLHGNLRH
jgi:hypothetical protein